MPKSSKSTQAVTKTVAYDLAEQLRTPEEMAAYLDAWMTEAPDDVAGIAGALGDIARAKGMAQVAKDAGLSRESLYKALSDNGNPSFATILKVTKALGVQLHAGATFGFQLGVSAACHTDMRHRHHLLGSPPLKTTWRSPMNQMPRHFLLATAAMTCLYAQGVLAQSIPSRAGLWVEASEAKINGNAAPTMLDIDGAMDEQTRNGIKQAMRKYGLPAGWNPSLSCITAQELNVQQWLKRTAKNCGNLSIKQSGNKFSFSGTCAMGGQSANVKGSAQFNGDKEVVHEARVEGTYQGKPVVSETRSVAKWVGADCNNPPAGIDPAWLGEMAAANP